MVQISIYKGALSSPKGKKKCHFVHQVALPITTKSNLLRGVSWQVSQRAEYAHIKMTDTV